MGMYTVRLHDASYNRMEFEFDDFKEMTFFLNYSIRYGKKDIKATVSIESEEGEQKND
jgi:hypothetical protein